MPNSCTMHRPNGRYHILFEDLRLIAADDIVNASVLRVLEQKTDKRIELLRDHYGIPEEGLPPDDLLWIDEEDASLRELERWSIGVRRKSSFARALKDRNPVNLPASLIQLGLVKRRWIARRNDRAWPICTHTNVQRDAHGPFLVVAEGNGDYYVNDKKHNAVMEGYSDICRQFLYCFEKVNRAIAALDGYDPPDPLLRWQPKQITPPKKREAHRNNVSVPGDARENTTAATTQGGYSEMSAGRHAFLGENTTNKPEPSMVPGSDPCPILDGTDQYWTTASKNAQPCPTAPISVSNFASTINKNPSSNGSNLNISKKDSVLLLDTGIDLELLRVAHMVAETIIGLSSARLSVPPKPDISNQAELHQWLVQWYEPAVWILNENHGEDPCAIWRRTDRRIAGALHGPTWYAEHRTTQSPVTLRNIVGPADPAKPLTGNNWHTIGKELDKKQWHPDDPVPYDGPPLEFVDYQAGYKGEEPATVPEPSIIVEEPEELPRPAWMSREEAHDLCDEIWDTYPALTSALTPVDGTRTQWYASIQWGHDPNDWHHLESADAWRNPSPETQHYLAQALSFAAERNIPTEVGVVEVAEGPPPIVLEIAPADDAPPAPDETYVSMDEISADLERGLRPLISSPPVEVVAVVVAKSPPPPVSQGKTGMSLLIAGLLLGQITSTGYAAQLRSIGLDRAMLTVEASPGTWIDIDSSATWQRHLKSVAQSPPGSLIGALEAMGGTVITMEVAQ